MLRYYEHLSEAEIAETLGVRPGHREVAVRRRPGAAPAVLADTDGRGAGMSFEDTIRRSIEDHVDRLEVPSLDVEAVRRTGRRRRAAGTAAASLAVLAVLSGGVALVGSVGGDDGRAVQPTGLPALDFDEGARAFYDDGSGEMHLGGAVFDLGIVTGMDTSASATPHGVVYFDDGRRCGCSPRTASPHPRRWPAGRGGLGPTVKYDATEPLVAWLSRDATGVVLTVHELGDDAGVVRARPPCPARARSAHGSGWPASTVAACSCAGPRTRPRSSTWPTSRQAGGRLTGSGRRRAQPGRARQGTLLRRPARRGLERRRGGGAGVAAHVRRRHELAWSSTLRSTDGGEPIRPRRTREGVEFVDLDSDGTVLVAVLGDERQRYFDCEVPPRAPARRSAARPDVPGDPIFLGNDM